MFLKDIYRFIMRNIIV